MQKDQRSEIKKIPPTHTHAHIKSFVRRDSRITKSQLYALKEFWPRFGIAHQEAGLVDFDKLFGRKAQLFLEIGFGSGQSLIALAKANPQQDFIGIETHKPGVGALLLAINREGLSNVRVFCGDAFEILQTCFADKVLDGVQIFFPDPWPKRRHQPRRLVRSDFIDIVAAKLQLGGVLHLATDWDDYAEQMMKVMSARHQFIDESDGKRSMHRRLITKFEARALREGRTIWDLKYCCQSC